MHLNTVYFAAVESALNLTVQIQIYRGVVEVEELAIPKKQAIASFALLNSVMLVVNGEGKPCGKEAICEKGLFCKSERYRRICERKVTSRFNAI